MGYLCGKFGDRSFSRFGSIMRTNKHKTYTDADERYTPATLVGMSRSSKMNQLLDGIKHL